MLSLKPERFWRWLKTKLKLWWWLGTATSSTMITSTPTTCHQTETCVNSATRGEEKMLISAWTIRMSANSTNTWCSEDWTLAVAKFTPNRCRP